VEVAALSDPLLSALWYRVADLKPKLRAHARVHRHVYRGQPWYVLEDTSTQRFHRFPPGAHTLIGLMDGERTVDEIWRTVTGTLGDAAPTQDELIRFLAQLHATDVLQCDFPPDAAELLQRLEKTGRRELMGRFLNPFAIRIPVWDPERFLTRGLPVIRPLVGWLGALLWLAVVVPALVLVGLHWTQLSEGFLDRVLTAQNLLLIWLTFPCIKALHELGHGFLAKAFGAEIHDMGIMLLVFTPVPYVDASSSSAFASKWQRAAVAAGGMLMEMFVAALALFVWVNAEPGAVRTVAFNAVLIAGVATLGFNANPLLRFDGYYVLSDLIEIPNLRNRANAFLGYLVERYAFGREEAEAPEADLGERAWLVGYALASFVYRVLVVVAIFFYVLDVSLVLGTILAALASVGWIGIPASKGLRVLVSDPRLRHVRARAVSVVGGTLALVALIVGLIPMPYRTISEGVVWIPDEALVRAESEGFVLRVAVEPGTWVTPGQLLITCVDPDLEAEVAVLTARLRVLDVRHGRELVADRVRAQLVEDERRYVRETLDRAIERRRALQIRSGAAGRFVSPFSQDLPGRFVRRGEILAQIVSEGDVTVRAVVSERDVELLRDPSDQVEVRLAEHLDRPIEARIQRIVPAASQQLPSSALGSAGGGQLAVDPRDQRGTNAVEKLFMVEIALPEASQVSGIGGRVHVRFDHGLAPLVAQWYRGLRQVFLARFDV